MLARSRAVEGARPRPYTVHHPPAPLLCCSAHPTVWPLLLVKPLSLCLSSKDGPALRRRPSLLLLYRILQPATDVVSSCKPLESFDETPSISNALSGRPRAASAEQCSSASSLPPALGFILFKDRPLRLG